MKKVLLMERKKEREREGPVTIARGQQDASIMMQINVTRGILRSASILFFSFFLRALQVH